MSAGELVLKSERVLFRSGLAPGWVWVKDGKIRETSQSGKLPVGIAVTDLGRDVLMPGIVDTHAHINEPGRTEWEGFTTATRACAAGGITTVIDMPLNSIPATTTPEALGVKIKSAEKNCAVDFGFWGGLVPGNA